MNAILQFNGSDLCNGPLARVTQKGPEKNLVQSFTDQVLDTFQTRSTRLAIFYEPLLETGFPDIVIAQYNPRLFENWSNSRLSLQRADFKVLQHIHSTKSTEAQIIQSQLGIGSKALGRVLERLLDSGLIKLCSNLWKPVSLGRVFGIKRLIAIEAKIKNLAAVLRQAQINQWFASETYVLLPVQQPTAKTLRKSEQLGIGIYVCNHRGVQELCPASRLSLPSCYASWLFNEWIGRRINRLS